MNKDREFKEGDKVRVVADNTKHGITTGTKVTVMANNSNGLYVSTMEGLRCVRFDDIEHIESPEDKETVYVAVCDVRERLSDFLPNFEKGTKIKLISANSERFGFEILKDEDHDDEGVTYYLPISLFQFFKEVTR